MMAMTFDIAFPFEGGTAFRGVVRCQLEQAALASSSSGLSPVLRTHHSGSDRLPVEIFTESPRFRPATSAPYGRFQQKILERDNLRDAVAHKVWLE